MPGKRRKATSPRPMRQPAGGYGSSRVSLGSGEVKIVSSQQPYPVETAWETGHSTAELRPPRVQADSVYATGKCREFQPMAERKQLRTQPDDSRSLRAPATGQ